MSTNKLTSPKKIGRPATGKTVENFCLTMKPEMIAVVDTYAFECGKTRSEIVTGLIVEAMMTGKFKR